MYELHVEKEISVAHHLKGYDGKCKRVHGHNLLIEVDLEASSLIKEGSQEGMVVDFREIKNIISYYDHTDLNKTLKGCNDRPTAEKMAKTIAEQIQERFKECNNLVYVEVKVQEERNQWAKYSLVKGV